MATALVRESLVVNLSPDGEVSHTERTPISGSGPFFLPSGLNLAGCNGALAYCSPILCAHPLLEGTDDLLFMKSAALDDTLDIDRTTHLNNFIACPSVT